MRARRVTKSFWKIPDWVAMAVLATARVTPEDRGGVLARGSYGRMAPDGSQQSVRRLVRKCVAHREFRVTRAKQHCRKRVTPRWSNGGSRRFCGTRRTCKRVTAARTGTREDRAHCWRNRPKPGGAMPLAETDGGPNARRPHGPGLASRSRRRFAPSASNGRPRATSASAAGRSFGGAAATEPCSR